MARSVAAIIGGYLVFGVSAALLFGLSGRDPHAVPSVEFALVSVTYGVLFAGLAGWVAAALSHTNPACHAGILASILAAIALISLALEFRAGSVWSELGRLPSGNVFNGRPNRDLQPSSVSPCWSNQDEPVRRTVSQSRRSTWARAERLLLVRRG